MAMAAGSWRVAMWVTWALETSLEKCHSITAEWHGSPIRVMAYGRGRRRKPKKRQKTIKRVN